MIRDARDEKSGADWDGPGSARGGELVLGHWAVDSKQMKLMLVSRADAAWDAALELPTIIF